MDWGELCTELGELKSVRWGKVKSHMQPAGSQDSLGTVTPKKRETLTVRDEWPQDEESEAGERKDCYSSILKRTRQQVSVLRWSEKNPSLCAPLALGTAPSVCENHWRPLFPLIPTHTSTSNLLLPLSTMITVMLIVEICAMDFSFQHCWFWESVNAKMPKISWRNLSVLLYFHAIIYHSHHQYNNFLYI